MTACVDNWKTTCRSLKSYKKWDDKRFNFNFNRNLTFLHSFEKKTSVQDISCMLNQLHQSRSLSTCVIMHHFYAFTITKFSLKLFSHALFSNELQSGFPRNLSTFYSCSLEQNTADSDREQLLTAWFWYVYHFTLTLIWVSSALQLGKKRKQSPRAPRERKIDDRQAAKSSITSCFHEIALPHLRISWEIFMMRQTFHIFVFTRKFCWRDFLFSRKARVMKRFSAEFARWEQLRASTTINFGQGPPPPRASISCREETHPFDRARESASRLSRTNNDQSYRSSDFRPLQAIQREVENISRNFAQHI